MPFTAPVDEVEDVSLAALDRIFTKTPPLVDEVVAIEQPRLMLDDAAPTRRARGAPKRRSKRRANTVNPTVH